MCCVSFCFICLFVCLLANNSEFAVWHVVQHGNVSGRRVQYGDIVGLVKVDGF